MTIASFFISSWTVMVNLTSSAWIHFCPLLSLTWRPFRILSLYSSQHLKTFSSNVILLISTWKSSPLLSLYSTYLNMNIFFYCIFSLYSSKHKDLLPYCHALYSSQHKHLLSYCHITHLNTKIFSPYCHFIKHADLLLYCHIAHLNVKIFSPYVLLPTSTWKSSL
jgi:hypothetical protein